MIGPHPMHVIISQDLRRVSPCVTGTVSRSGGAFCGDGGKAHAYLNDKQQLVAVDAPAAVHIVQFEVPTELLLHLPLQHQAQRGHVLHEVNVAILNAHTHAHTQAHMITTTTTTTTTTIV